MVDLMVNHISRRSPEFQDFVAHGRSSKWSDLFVTVEKIWPDGGPTAADIEAIFLRKPEHPSTDVRIVASEECERIWTTFGSAVDTSEQVDLDIRSPLAWPLYQSCFANLAAHGVTSVRLGCHWVCHEEGGHVPDSAEKTVVIEWTDGPSSCRLEIYGTTGS